jgi:hypothetical protein
MAPLYFWAHVRHADRQKTICRSIFARMIFVLRPGDDNLGQRLESQACPYDGHDPARPPDFDPRHFGRCPSVVC